MRHALHLARARRNRLAARVQSNPPVLRSLYLKINYSSSVNYKALSRIINRHRHLVSHVANIGISHGTQRNLFRRFSSLNWPRKWPAAQRRHSTLA